MVWTREGMPHGPEAGVHVTAGALPNVQVMAGSLLRVYVAAGNGPEAGIVHVVVLIATGGCAYIGGLNKFRIIINVGQKAARALPHNGVLDGATGGVNRDAVAHDIAGDRIVIAALCMVQLVMHDISKRIGAALEFSTIDVDVRAVGLSKPEIESEGSVDDCHKLRWGIVGEAGPDYVCLKRRES
jgi:hypothetical protein